MKILEVDKPYSWLSWPVNLKSTVGVDLHLTAKFFGHARIDPAAVRLLLDRVGGVTAFNPESLRKRIDWKPVVFDGPTYVLEFTRYPKTFSVVHDLFRLVADQYKPWRPHITVPEVYWKRVQAEGLTPFGEELFFHEIELYVGKNAP